jgi:hypothetical protein
MNEKLSLTDDSQPMNMVQEDDDLLKCDEPLDNIEIGAPSSSGYYEHNLDYMN